MAAARIGATLPILRCRAWLNLVRLVAGGGGISTWSWHPWQACHVGSRLSPTLVLLAALGWQERHSNPIPRCRRCGKGAAWQTAAQKRPNTRNRLKSLFSRVGQMPDFAIPVLGNQQAAVGQLQQSHRPAPHLALVGSEHPALYHLADRARGFAVFEGDEGDGLAHAHGAVPGSVEAQESAALILRRKL